jgi:ribose 5-phosphate isomerase B
MIVSIASDHAGYELRQKVIKHLQEKGFEVLDGGAPNGTDSYSYVDAGVKVAEDVISGRADRGIAICGTGIGISIAANKVKGVRCGLCTSVEMATLTKQHNNANVLALGGRTTETGLAMQIVDAWLDTEFEGGRHERRTGMLDEM